MKYKDMTINALLNNILILFLAFTGGFIIMAIELLGGRILAPYFGSSIYVWGSIITIFMLSLSTGYLVGGRLSLHNPSLRRYSLFFLFGAVFIVPIILWAEPLMEMVFLAINDPRYGSLVISLLLFFPPTAILGMVSPYSVRLLVVDRHSSGQVAGSLYFVSTMGSALGTIGTSFYLVLWFEVNQILMVLSGTLLAGGLLAMLADKKLSPPAIQPDERLAGELL